MKINRLNHTKSLFPHFYDKTDYSNFTKHLKVVGKSQYDIRHKLKTIEWSRILEKPLQIWKEQTESYVYDMHFKVIMPYLKEVNVYKNPILNSNEEIIGFEKVDNPEDLDENGEQIGRAIHKTFEYENRVRLYEDVLSDLVSAQRVPNDTFLLEVYTWDDYHFLKGFPENDYTVKEDNILQYRYNETFLSINVEEISYSKYLTFRIHKDKIKQIRIYKNDSVLLNLLFDINLIGKSSSTDFSYTYFDDDFTNEKTYLQSAFDSYFEVEGAEHNNVLVYLEEDNLDEYVLRIPLSDSDFDENGVVKDIYDLEVTSFEKRYRCRHEYDRVYTKRYCGYDEQLNDCFDHDYSLDMIGRLLNIHRFRFYQIYKMNDKYLSRTYPTYNNRATEDDYHYMKRIQFYISNYNHIVFPVLEFWKYYHTMATIKSRKRIVGEMDYAYFRTRDSVDYICSDEISLDEEEFDSETVIEYSINKATVLEGIANFINLDRGWYEATVVNNVYVVPSTDYGLRYGIKDKLNEEYLKNNTGMVDYIFVNALPTPSEQTLNKLYVIWDNDDGYVAYKTISADEDNDEVLEYSFEKAVENIPYVSGNATIRLICYNRNGIELRTTPIIPTSANDSTREYTITTGYTYIDTPITIPSDTVSIKLVLESNDSFSFTDVSFERMTVTNFDNYYMETETDYNPNVYELYTVYEDLPSNLRIGGDRFDILFKRSLPITKKGFFFIDVDEEESNALEISNDFSLHYDNILTTGLNGTIGNNGYENTASSHVLGDCDYVLSYFITSNSNGDDVATTTITYNLSDNTEIVEEMDKKVYSDAQTHIAHEFTTPSNTESITINIDSDADAILTDIRLSRETELSDEEMY